VQKCFDTLLKLFYLQVCACFIDRSFTVHNGTIYINVGIKLSGRTWVTFQVRTAKDATITLLNHTSHITHEVVLGAGGNTYACVR